MRRPPAHLQDWIRRNVGGGDMPGIGRDGEGKWLRSKPATIGTFEELGVDAAVHTAGRLPALQPNKCTACGRVGGAQAEPSKGRRQEKPLLDAAIVDESGSLDDVNIGNDFLRDDGRDEGDVGHDGCGDDSAVM